MKKDFVEVTPASGSNNGALSVKCDTNTGSARSTEIKVSGGGLRKV